MDTKSKNRWLFIIWILLFTFGISGILTVLFSGQEYIKKDYFHTPQFEGQMNQFVENLKRYELAPVNKEELIKQITVTEEEINEHRYRYGDLTTQISNIKSQYEQKVQEAVAANNQELIVAYAADRDRKIADITNNFKSDDYVRPKVVKEKEQKIEQHVREMERDRPEFVKEKSLFTYYLKDTTTGKIYTNLNLAQGESADKYINDNKMFLIRTYPSQKYDEILTEYEAWIENGEKRVSPIKYDEVATATHEVQFENGETVMSPVRSEKKFEGKIALSKSIPSTNQFMMDYRDYRQKQLFLLVYGISSIPALFLAYFINRRTPVLKLIATERWQPYYHHVPKDVAAIALLGTVLVTLFFLVVNTNIYNMHIYQDVYSFAIDKTTMLLIIACLVALALIQWKFWRERTKEAAIWQEDWQRSLTYRVYKGMRDAFMLRSLGVQLFLLLGVVFAAGFGAGIVLLENELIIVYAPLFVVVCLPTLFLIIKSVGYFNQIVVNTNGLAQGRMESDIPVTGKSTLSVLAGNVNTLKHGIKVSQKEQAKSERLKTELITNVSHDLRTPLTSIITYTELLKTADASSEEHAAYIEIIDRKSKRLKVLIDDLFEASKMASGNIELMKEKVDIVQLLQQALAEYNESIGESTLQFRVTNPDAPVYAVVDGQKLWRVFDNLIGNILKYSLENTRVYIAVKIVQNEAVITFKNVTKYELSEDIDELFERFKRGDTSRHTEGSGLGLAIAKSIMDLHQGGMDIEVDGDLFKVTVSLPIV
ncbi:sensor histidine kinase [Aneurinibacillus sp. REN35]|uniref:sensor histidine kinase n=1 Tax=Aneurinibacillus sp. REN35 TaxID=3237286 RepID=UPI0035282048